MTGRKFIQRLLLFAYCLAGCFSPASGQSVSATPEDMDTPPFKIVYHSWNSKDGLPSWKVDAFLHDSRGLMWMNTGRDIFNFDGHTFRQVATLSNVVQGEKISALAEDLHGNIWIIRHAKEYATIGISHFFANVTHELRSPLTLILGPVDHLLNNKTKPQRTYDYLRTIQRNAHKLLNLVDELPDLSKVESNKLVLDEKPALLYPFLNRCLASFRPFAEQYLIEARLLKARFLLENKAFQTVAEVCFTVGFSSTQYFSRIVKSRFGKSPSDFLRQQ